MSSKSGRRCVYSRRANDIGRREAGDRRITHTFAHQWFRATRAHVAVDARQEWIQQMTSVSISRFGWDGTKTHLRMSAFVRKPPLRGTLSRSMVRDVSRTRCLPTTGNVPWSGRAANTTRGLEVISGREEAPTTSSTVYNLIQIQ